MKARIPRRIAQNLADFLFAFLIWLAVVTVSAWMLEMLFGGAN